MTARPRKRPAKKVPAAPVAPALDAAAARAAAKEAKRGRAAQREEFYQRMHGEVDGPALTRALRHVLAAQPDAEADPADRAPATRRGRGARAAPAPRDFPDANADRWIPIGPTVVRRGQAMSRPRVSGRVKDIAVAPDGKRAYILTAKGGVWYTENAGTTWEPVGGWAGRSVNAAGNGNMFSGGALLVDFDDNLAGLDYVMVGTGEPSPARTATGFAAQGGVGVLAAFGPVVSAIDDDPWEADTGYAQLAGLGVRRLVRRPGASPFEWSGATQDRVLAATTGGLFIGTRSDLPAVAAGPPPAPQQPRRAAVPARHGFTWARCAASPAADITDAVWLPRGGGNTRIVFAVKWVGVFFSDHDGTDITPIAPLQAPAIVFSNRISLAVVPGTNRVYVLAETLVGAAPNQTPKAALWRIDDVVGADQVVVTLPNMTGASTNVPADLFGDPAKPPTQAWYDHGLAVEQVGTKDRIYLAGSGIKPRTGAEAQFGASLFCFETAAPPAAVTPLAAVPGVSRSNNPPLGDGGDRDGLIGNNVHADVHAVRLTGPAAPARHVWVGCDGGVFVSEHSGRVNTFGARNTGLATLEPIFVAPHPRSSHFVAAGFQDNGSQVRVGDTVWEEVFLGDGGGTVFHPVRTDVLVTQYIKGRWNGTPADAYLDPLTRSPGYAGLGGREEGAAAFYSGAATVFHRDGSGRVALGTNRVWLTDNIGSGTPVQWRTLPYPIGTARDTRAGGADPLPAFGVPGFATLPGNAAADQVIDMAWLTDMDLLVIHQGGLVRYTNNDKPTDTWSVRTWRLGAGTSPLKVDAVMTAVAPIPNAPAAERRNFYLATLGDPIDPTVETVWFYDDATGAFKETGLRRKLDYPGPPVVAGPCDPCFALVVDPITKNVFAGTATGVWKGEPIVGGWRWSPFMNGLPQATVQDLRIWSDSVGDPASPRLLRAGVQSRGVWEVDLAHPEPRRTYVRVHLRDDRRRFPTPLANPRLRPPVTYPSPQPAMTSTDVPTWASPDIVVRPKWPRMTPPVFHGPIWAGNLPVYDLWTFQTAFRWLYPSCVPDGQWSDAMRDLVHSHRSVLNLSSSAVIDETLWKHVVGGVVGGQQRGVYLRPDLNDTSKATAVAAASAAATDSLAVYRAPWHTPLNFDGPGTEIDLLEAVFPVRRTGWEWTVFREPCTVDVLLHHRDSRPVVPDLGDHAYAVLLWRFAPTAAELLATPAAGIAGYLASVRAAGVGAAAPAAPAGWRVATDSATGPAMHTLTSVLDARLPRAVPVDVDLSAAGDGNRVLLLALVGSTVDDPVVAPVVGAPVTVADLVQAWPHAAMRIVRVIDRV